MTPDTDLAIIGSGFGGSILAMIARRCGLRVALVERGRHPRFAIGESASPLAGILIENLADRYDLPRLRPLSSYGTWQRQLPEVVCGLKRGFTFFKHRDGERYRPGAGRTWQLLVAASPSDELSDTHWLRADVDHFLVQEATALGADYLDQVTLESLDWTSGLPVLNGNRAGRSLSLRARFVVDASGPSGFLSRALNIADCGFASYPATQALYSHFTGVARCDEMEDYGPGSATCGRAEAPPYPVDDAALHHVFDGGWMWVLRFRNGVTSAGVAVSDDVAADVRLADGEPAWRRLLARYPSVAAQFATARATREFTWMARMPWRVAVAAGEGWAMLPSAAAFVDPLFSTGIPLTLLGIERIARLFEREGGPEGPPLRQSSHIRGGGPRPGGPRGGGPRGGGPRRGGPRGGGPRGGGPSGPPISPSLLAEYSDVTLAEADHTARYIAGCYAAFPRFETFTAYSMFYFAAASFSELARRLAVDSRPRRFLCADHPHVGPATGRLSPALYAAAAAEGYAEEVARAIECLNIAGLCDPLKRNWYPVEFVDAIRGAWKLGVAPDAVRETLARRVAAV